MTPVQSLKIYGILQKHFKNDEDARTVVEEIEGVIDQKLLQKDMMFSTKEDLLELGAALREEMASQQNQFVLWQSEMKADQLLIRTELNELRLEVRSELNKNRSEFKKDLSELRSELKQDMSEMRSEFKLEHTLQRSDFQQEMLQLRVEMEKRFHAQTGWIIGTAIALGGLIIAMNKI
jgi:hypothetical protein